MIMHGNRLQLAQSTILLTIFLISCFSASLNFGIDVSAQPSTHFYIVSGTVFDQSGDCVPNAVIEFKNPVTGEIFNEEANTKGNYSGNLANFEEGWEEGQEIIITARKSVYVAESIYPDSEKDEAGRELNFTIPYVIIVSPISGVTINKEEKEIIVEIEFLPSLNVSTISYTISSMEFANTTDNSSILRIKEYSDGSHIIRVTIIETSGETHSAEIFITLESDDDDSNLYLIILAILVVLIIAALGIFLYKKSNSQGKNTQE